MGRHHSQSQVRCRATYSLCVGHGGHREPSQFRDAGHILVGDWHGQDFHLGGSIGSFHAHAHAPIEAGILTAAVAMTLYTTICFFVCICLFNAQPKSDCLALDLPMQKYPDWSSQSCPRSCSGRSLSSQHESTNENSHLQVNRQIKLSLVGILGLGVL